MAAWSEDRAPPRTHVRDLPELWPLRQRRNALIVCGAAATAYEQAGEQLAELRADVIVEDVPAALSAALGRPSVTVVDRYGTIGLHEQAPTIDDVLTALESFELECPECGPQAWGDPGGIRDA